MPKKKPRKKHYVHIEELIRSNLPNREIDILGSNGGEYYVLGDKDKETFYFWFSEYNNNVSISIAKHFDRWANSRDFMCAIPYSQRDWDRMMRRLQEEMDAGNFDSGWAKEIWL